MKIFLLDLWHDLREKRLWPVAVVLAVGLVAVPVVLSKPSVTPPAPPAEQNVRTAPDPDELKALAAVKLDETADGRGSSLNTFDPSNPFSPPKAITKKKKAEGTPSSVTSDQGGDAGSGGGGESGGSTGGDTGSSGGDTGSGGDTPTTGGGDKPTVTRYRYVVDVTFTANGRTRRIKSMDKLEMLPNEQSPLLLFLGVSADAGNAVFLVDSTLKAAGEGRCKPRASECAFLYLGAGSEHEFTNADGDSYTLRIDEIRKVRVGGQAAASRGKRAGAAVGPPTEARRFELPLFADLVSVSSDGADDSSDQTDRR